MKQQPKHTGLKQKVSTFATEDENVLTFPPAFEHMPFGVAYVSLQGHWLYVNQQICDITGYTQGEMQKITFLDILYPGDLEKPLASVPYLLTGQSSGYSLEKRCIRKDRSCVWVNLSVSLVPASNRVPGYFVVTIEDITQRKQIEEKYQEFLEKEVGARIEAEHVNEQLKILQAITDSALTHMAPDELFHSILSRIRYIMAADNIAILLLNEESQTLTVRAAQGVEEIIAPEVCIPLGKGFAGRIAAQCQPLTTNDIKTVEIINPVLREQIQSLLGVPLVVNERVIGVVHIGMKRLHASQQRISNCSSVSPIAWHWQLKEHCCMKMRKSLIKKCWSMHN